MDLVCIWALPNELEIKNSHRHKYKQLVRRQFRPICHYFGVLFKQVLITHHKILIEIKNLSILG